MFSLINSSVQCLKPKCSINSICTIRTNLLPQTPLRKFGILEEFPQVAMEKKLHKFSNKLKTQNNKISKSELAFHTNIFHNYLLLAKTHTTNNVNNDFNEINSIILKDIQTDNYAKWSDKEWHRLYYLFSKWGKL